jgi:hypothetical protein
VREKPQSSQIQIEEKAKNIVSAVLSKNIIRIEGDDNYSTEIKAMLKEIALTRPGRKLLKRILKTAGIVIRDSKNDPFNIFTGGDHFNAADQKINLKLNQHDFYIGGKDKFLKHRPFMVTLAHELIHAMHYHENMEAAKARKKQTENLLHKKFDDLEEQFTILGFADSDVNNLKELEICENAFLRVFNLPPRFNHTGVDTDRNQFPNKINIGHCIFAKAYGSISESTDDRNQPLDLSWIGADEYQHLSNKKLLPLSLALKIKKNKKMVQLLVEKGAKIDAIDQIGGPLHAACTEKNFSFVENYYHTIKNEIVKYQFLLEAFLSHPPHLEIDRTKYLNVLELLLTNQAAEEKAPIAHQILQHQSWSSNCVEVLQWLIDKKGKHVCYTIDHEGNTLIMRLYLALVKNKYYTKLFEKLLQELQIDLSKVNKNKQNLLSLALEQEDKDNVNAIMHAMQNRQMEIDPQQKQQAHELNAGNYRKREVIFDLEAYLKSVKPNS